MKLDPPPLQMAVDEGQRVLAMPWMRWFQRLYNALQTLLGTQGGAGVNSPYGAFCSTVNQTAAANTVTLVTLNTTLLTNGVTLATNKLTFGTAGTYRIDFAIQTSNATASDDNVITWVRKNGTDIANSAFITSTPAKHGSTSGFTLGTWAWTIVVAAGDYIELYWATDGGTSSITNTAASGSPAHPAAPAVNVDISFVSS